MTPIRRGAFSAVQALTPCPRSKKRLYGRLRGRGFSTQPPNRPHNRTQQLTRDPAPSTSKTALDTLSPPNRPHNRTQQRRAPDSRRPGLTPSWTHAVHVEDRSEQPRDPAPSTSKTALDTLSPQIAPTTGLSIARADSPCLSLLGRRYTTAGSG